MAKTSRSKETSRKTTKTAKKPAKKTTKRPAKKTSQKPAKKTAKKPTRKTARKGKTVKSSSGKTSKKTTTKKVAGAAKIRQASRHRVYNLTKEVPEHHYFVLANGRQVKHVAELASILDQLEDHVFNHHVRPDSNDFHNWVRDIFEDVELARKVAGVSDKKKLQLVIYRHLAGHE